MSLVLSELLVPDGPCNPMPSNAIQGQHGRLATYFVWSIEARKLRNCWCFLGSHFWFMFTQSATVGCCIKMYQDFWFIIYICIYICICLLQCDVTYLELCITLLHAHKHPHTHIYIIYTQLHIYVYIHIYICIIMYANIYQRSSVWYLLAILPRSLLLYISCRWVTPNGLLRCGPTLWRSGGGGQCGVARGTAWGGHRTERGG
jgi:hypothetical protein